jgi:hypothetical protein
VFDGLRGGNCYQQRARVRVADVLGGQHDHASRDEAGVLAAREHRGEGIYARGWLRSAQRLDERRN